MSFLKTMAYASSEPASAGRDRFFLPDFCSIRMVLAVVLTAQLLSFLLMLGAWSGTAAPWEQLGLISLFVQWVALSSAGVLCLARPALCRLSNVGGGIISYLLVLAVTVLLSVIAYAISRRLHLPIGAETQLGFIARNVAIGAICAAVVLRLLYLQHMQRASVEAQAQARIEALQARIRPHFLFNSINTIAALTHSHPERAEEALEDLSDLFRHSLGGAGRLVPLAEELDSGRRYLRMESLRLGERLRVAWEVDDLPEGALLPPLTLQPLLENAVYHGIERLPEGGTVRVSGQAQGGRVRLMVSNPVPITGKGERSGHQLALENISERLQFAFGRRAELRFGQAEDQWHVELIVPLQEANANEGPDH